MEKMMSYMLTIRQLANRMNLTKMAIVHRMHKIPNFRSKYTRVSTNKNHMILISNKGADVLEDYSSKNEANTKHYRMHKQQRNDADLASLEALKIRLQDDDRIIESKDNNLQQQRRNLRDKQAELNQVHKDLSNTQILLGREQKLGEVRSSKYEKQIRTLKNRVKELPQPKKKGFWSKLFGL